MRSAPARWIIAVGCRVVAQIPRCSVHTSLRSKAHGAGFARGSSRTAASPQIPVRTKNGADQSFRYRLAVPRCLFCRNGARSFLKSE